MSTKEQIVSTISREGPMLPVEISAKVGLDSFLIKGYLEELIKEGRIKVSEHKVGSDYIFYIEGQEETLNKKYQDSKDAVLRARSYQDKQIRETPELLKKREEFIQRLKEIENREKREIQEEAPKESKKPFFKFREHFEKKTPEPEPKPKEKVPFLKIAENFLAENGINIIEKKYEKKKTEEIIISIPSKIHPISHLAIIKDKKKINKSDLALAYTKSLESKMPVLFITHGDLTKGGKEYLEEVGEFLKIKKIK